MKKTSKNIVTWFLILVTVFLLVGCSNPGTSEENALNVSESERELLAKLVFAESSICCEQCQRSIASVVINMLESGHWGDSISEVIYYRNAFSPVKQAGFESLKPNQAAYNAVDYVIKYGSILPKQVRYFRASYDFDWDGYVPYKNCCNVYFGYLSDWENGAK